MRTGAAQPYRLSINVGNFKEMEIDSLVYYMKVSLNSTRKYTHEYIARTCETELHASRITVNFESNVDHLMIFSDIYIFC